MPRKEQKRLPIHIKVRVRATRPMTKEEAEKLTNRAIRTGIIPEGIKLALVDWERGAGTKEFDEGEYVGKDAHDALVAFKRALTDKDASRRFAVADEED